MNNSSGLKIAALIGLIGRASGSVSTLLTTMLLARMLTTGEFGEYMLVMTIMLIGSLIGALGMGEATLRFVGKKLGAGDHQAAWAVCAKGVFCGTAGLLLVGFVFFIGLTTFGHYLPDLPGGPAYAAITGFWLIASGLMVVLSCALRAFDKIGLGTLVEITSNRVVLLVVLAAMYVCHVKSLMAVLVASAGISAAVAAWAAFMLWRLAPPEYRGGRCDTSLGELLLFALPLLGSNVLFRIMSDASLWLVALYCQAADVGLYGAAYRLWVVFSLPQIAVNAAIQGQIARRHAAGDTVGLEKLMRGAAMTAFWPTLAITAVVCVAGQNVLGVLYGSAFEGGSSVLSVLCLCQLLCVMVGSSEHLAGMSGRQNAVLLSSFVSTIMSLALAILLLPRLGPIGGAIAAGAASLAFKVMLAWFCYQRLQVKTWVMFRSGRHDRNSLNALKLANAHLE